MFICKVQRHWSRERYMCDSHSHGVHALPLGEMIRLTFCQLFFRNKRMLFLTWYIGVKLYRISTRAESKLREGEQGYSCQNIRRRGRLCNKLLLLDCIKLFDLGCSITLGDVETLQMTAEQFKWHAPVDWNDKNTMWKRNSNEIDEECCTYRTTLIVSYGQSIGNYPKKSL